MKAPNRTLIIVADGEKYIALRNEGDEDIIDCRVVSHEEIDNPPTREQASDRAGRFDDAGIGKSAVQQTDWHQLEKERFAEDLAEKLNDWALQNRFKDLVVIAAPQTLGVLRPAYHSEVEARLLGEIAKDLTNHTLEDIEKHLSEA